MKSIRLSLTSYFLGLLLLALGAVSLLVYQHSTAALQQEKKAQIELINATKNAEKRQINATLDNNLSSQARTLSTFLRLHYDHRWVSQGAFGPYKTGSFGGLIASSFMPNAHVTSPLWIYQHRNRSIMNLYYRYAARTITTEIRVDQDNPIQPINPEMEEFYQVNSGWGSTYYSPNMDGRSLAFDPSVLKQAKLLDVRHETTSLGNKRVRVVKMKVPASRRVSLEGHPSRRRRGDREQQSPRPALYVQYACDISEHSKHLNLIKKERIAEIQAVEKNTQDAEKRIRNYLLALGGGAFALGILGCVWLVRLGLAPLRRLSESVSRITEKDFRLHYDSKHIPSEVTPIVERLKQTLEQLKRAFAREKQATADLSHDLRTPVAALLTTIDFSLRKPRTTEEYRETLEDCRICGQQMNQIVEKLLSLARLDAGVANLQSQKVDVKALAQECVAMIKPVAENRGLTVSILAEEIDASVRADATKLREVLNNLLQNAVQYNRPNGSIEVEVAREKNELSLRVKDSGIGIAPKDQPLIFERFYRADSSRHSDELNAGLGLAIAQGYVDLMGGSLSVESKQGEGSTFCIHLPA